MSPRKRVISIFLIIVLLVTAPFSIYAEESDDGSYIAAQQFFTQYNFNRTESNSHQLNCTNSTQTNWTCTISKSTTNDTTNWYNTMIIPAGLSPVVPTAYTTSVRTRVTRTPLYIVFLANTNITSANIAAYPSSSSYNVSFERVTNDNQTLNTPVGFYFITLKVVSSNAPSPGSVWTTLKMPFNTATQVIPLFFGSEAVMSDNMHRLVFGTGQEMSVFDSRAYSILGNISDYVSDIDQMVYQYGEDYSAKLSDLNTKATTRNEILTGINTSLQSGNTQANAQTVVNDNKTYELTNSINDLIGQEDDFMDSMDSSLQNIQMNNSIISDNHFLSSANWVRQQYNTMISNNPFGSLLYLCLSLGLSLLILGKLR